MRPESGLLVQVPCQYHYTDSAVTTIFFYKGLTRNLEIWKYPSLSFPQHLETEAS